MINVLKLLKCIKWKAIMTQCPSLCLILGNYSDRSNLCGDALWDRLTPIFFCLSIDGLQSGSQTTHNRAANLGIANHCIQKLGGFFCLIMDLGLNQMRKWEICNQIVHKLFLLFWTWKQPCGAGSNTGHNPIAMGGFISFSLHHSPTSVDPSAAICTITENI